LKNKHKATLILTIFSIGFLISYPFHDNFWMGLVSSACAASMIGGLADWFAVTAIFRRPLNIYWPGRIFRTEIIPKNRESIINGLVDIVENELLSKENIKKKILYINFNELLIIYMKDKSIDHDTRELLGIIIDDLLGSLTLGNVEIIMDNIMQLGIEKLDLAALLSKLLTFMREKAYDEEIIDFLLDFLAGFIRNSKMHIFLTNFVQDIIIEYENGSQSRAMAIKMLMNFALKMTTSDIAKIIEKGLVDAIYDVKNKENITRIKLKNKVDGLINDLKNNEEFRSKINVWKNSQISRIPNMTREWGLLFEKIKDADVNFNKGDFGNVLDKFFKNTLDNLENNENQRKKFDLFIKGLIIGFVNKKHNTIGTIVKERINQYSTVELVQLIEDIAGNDLQMIRINGSVVGGIVGILTYLLTFYIR
jgi:uncharacterized membrane-anchored protein YjiN (DUF445 family)